jgi:protease II
MVWSGKLKKKNTFKDFIACSTYLIDQNILLQHICMLKVGSAGGLLMGVILNMAPQLYHGVTQVPFVDVATVLGRNYSTNNWGIWRMGNQMLKILQVYEVVFSLW